MSSKKSDEPEPIGPSGRRVDDFEPFCEGDIDPTSNKRIRTLIDCDTNYLVYLDDDQYAEWTFNGESPLGFDDVANRIGRLETLSRTELLPSQLELFERILAESMARILGDHKEDKAKAILDEAEAYLKARGAENARRWFLTGVAWVALPASIISGILMLILRSASSTLWQNVLQILSACALGSLGAFLSVASRTEDITFEPAAGPSIHHFEGGIRVVVGMAGALFVALAMKGDLLLGVFYHLPIPFIALLVACVIAGASERLVPGLINDMAKSMNIKKSDASTVV